MKNKQTYIKGDKVWVTEPVETGTSYKRPAQIVSAKLNIAYPNRESHVAVRYLDTQGTDAYQCISQSRIVGHIDEQPTNNVQ